MFKSSLATQTRGHPYKFQVKHTSGPRPPATTVYKWWNCQVIQTGKLLSTHPSKPFLDGFPDPSGVRISELEQKVNTYQTEMSRFIWENSLVISAPKSLVTLFTPDPAQANWGQQKETLLLTYKVLGRSISNYVAPVWSTYSSESNISKIQRAQNEALRIITGSHKMTSIDHLHSETEMLQVEDHLNLLSAQYLVQCLDTENVCHHITKIDLITREMKETIFTRHNQTVLPLLENNR